MSQATALLADAETSIKAGEWDQALEQLENLKKDQPSQPEVYEKLAHVLAVRGKFQSVITTYLELIRILVEAEQLEHADGVVSQVLALKPESGEARERRIEIETKRGNTGRAVSLSRELARLCIDQGDGERSIRLLQDALKFEPGNLDIALELAEMFVSHGHIQDGANQYRKVANAFQEAGNIAKAAEAYRRMKVVQSDDPEVLLTLGRLYTELGKLDEAEQEFRSVLRHDLDHEQALLQLGLVCQLKGRFRSGILAFNKVLQNNPNLVTAKRKLGELHHSQGMMTEAVDFFLQAAQGYLEAEEKDEAIECFQIILSVDENNAPAQQGLTNLGAPVVAKAFEPPTPPVPPAEEPAPAPAAPPPMAAAPEPVSGGVANERTERLQPMNFDAPGAAEPPRPEAQTKRPLSGNSPGGAAGGASGGGTAPPPGVGRRGLVGGDLSMKQGLVGHGGKPMLGSEKPTLARSGGVRREGLGMKGGMAGSAGDKPMLGNQSGPGDRRPKSVGAEASPPPPVAPSPSRPSSFADSAPLEDFSADMAFDDVFADPVPTPEYAAPAVAFDDDLALPESSLFDDDPAPAAAPLSIGQAGTDLFDSDDSVKPPAQGDGTPVIGSFSGFDSDDDGTAPASSSLRPSFAPDEPPSFPEASSDDLFDFGSDSDFAPPASTAPTLAKADLFDDTAAGDDLFGDPAAPDDLFGGGDDLFGSGEQSSPQIAPPQDSLFDEPVQSEPAQDQGMFEGDSDPFENLFDEPAAADPEPASETIGGSLGDTKGSTAVPDLFFDDEAPAADISISESAFGSLFDEPEMETKAPVVFADDDLFGGGDDLFGDHEPEVAAAAPTLVKAVNDGLFSADSASNDLFGDDDLFSGPEPSGAVDDGFGGPEDQGLFDSGEPLPQEDLFSEADGDDGFTLDAPMPQAESVESAGLFADDTSMDGLFDGVAAEDDGLFTQASDAGGDIFGGPGSALDDDLFGTPPGGGLGGDDFLGNGSAAGDSGLFGSDSAAPPVMPSSGEGLFDDLDSGSDTLFDGFDSPAATQQPEPAPASRESAVDDGLFSGSENDQLFGGDDDLFADLTPAAAVEPAQEPSPGSHDLFGDALSVEDARDDLRLPMDSGSDDLFGAAQDDGSLFDIPLTAAEAPDAAVEALNFQEPAPISIPDPVAEPEASSESLFGDEAGGGDLFADLAMDDSPPPLDLDLPMPGDAPLFAQPPEAPSAAAEPEVSEPSNDLFGEQPDHIADLFGDGGFGNDSGFDAPLSFDIPEPTAEPLSSFSSAEVAAEPVSEPEPEAEAPEFMAMLELTLPKAEEEASAEPDPEPISIPEPQLEEALDIPLNFGVEDDIFAPSADLVAPESSDSAPLFEEPAPAIEEDPADQLSAEERMEIAQTEQADTLEASLAGADVASKIAVYRKTLEEDPDNLVLRTRLADIHLKYGLLEDAVVQYRQVLRRNPDSISLLHRVIQAEFWNENYVEAGDSLLALAHLHLKLGQQHDALDALQSVLSLDPLHFEARKELVSVFASLDESKLAAHHLRQLAETALTKGEVAGAISAFQQLLEISDDPTFEERLAQIYESQGDVVKALASFQILVGRYRADERWEEAARVTERIVELDPGQLSDREALIALYQRLGQSVAAVEQQFQLARRYQERNELEAAISLYEDVLKYQVDNFEARRYLVDAYLDAGRVPAALAQAESLTEHYLDTKDHGTAISLYTRLVEADPENVELQERLVKFYGLAGDPENAKARWIGISELHERHARYDRAAEALQKALQLTEELDLLYRLALLYAQRLGDNQAALGQLRKLFQLAPDRTEAVKMYIDLLLKEEQVSEAGQVLQRLEQAGGEGVDIKSSVIASLRSSVEANPNDLKARFNYGELCYHLGDLDHAIEQFQQTRKHPDYELVSYNMLGLCFASKRGYMMMDLAIKQFQKGLESKGRPESEYLEIRYNLAMVQYQNGRAKEALNELKECYNVDIAYRDVRSWMQKIESELGSSPA